MIHRSEKLMAHYSRPRKLCKVLSAEKQKANSKKTQSREITSEVFSEIQPRVA